MSSLARRCNIHVHPCMPPSSCHVLVLTPSLSYFLVPSLHEISMHHFFLLLSLSGKIDAFIKHGEKKATVEIELQRNPGSVVIKREIEQGGARGKTAWYIDGKGCKEEEVKKLTKSQWRKGYFL